MKLAFLLALAAAAAQPATPESINRNVDIDEHLGAQLPLDLQLVDDSGHPTTLRAALGDGKPVVLSLAYMRCRMLCDLVLRGLVDTLRASGLKAGVDYRAVTVSIDPKDTPAVSHLRKIKLLQTLDDPHAPWPFLMGTDAEIHRLAKVLGYEYVYDPKSDQYAHPAVAFVLTPDGKISRYLYGVRFRPLDLRLALSEASKGKVGGIVDRVLLTCFHWDPTTRKYGFVVTGVVRGGAALVLLALAGGIFYLIRLERRREA